MNRNNRVVSKSSLRRASRHHEIRVCERLKTIGGNGHADGGNHLTRVVVDRCGNATQVGQDFLQIVGVALLADL